MGAALPTRTLTPTYTFTIDPNATNTYTETNTPTFTDTNTFTNTNTFTITNTYTRTRTRTLTKTPTMSKTLTPTFTTSPTHTFTNTFTFTNVNTNTAVPTNTPVPTSTLTFTPWPNANLQLTQISLANDVQTPVHGQATAVESLRSNVQLEFQNVDQGIGDLKTISFNLLNEGIRWVQTASPTPHWTQVPHQTPYWPSTPPPYSVPVSEVHGESLYDRIAQGKANGYEAFEKTGYLPANPGATESTIWALGGLYQYIATPSAVRVRSASVSDTGAGIGAQQVYYKYLDIAGASKAETITLSGTTPVTTANSDTYRVQNFRVRAVGTMGRTVGNVTLESLSGAVTYSAILAGGTRARNSTYTVPAGKTLYITSVSASCVYTTVGKSQRITLHANYDSSISAPLNFFMPYAEVLLVDNVVVRPFLIPLKFPAGTDIKTSVIGESNAQVETTMRGYLTTP